MIKKTILTLCAAIFLGTTTASADEGMWTLFDLPQAVYEVMQQEGYELPYDALYKGDNAVMKSVVNFSGYCSGVVVSADGLVFTNHHCGFEAIRSHSTVEHDYMLNGFVANSYEEELPNENLFVSFMIEQHDITKKMLDLGIADMDLEHRAQLIDSVENAISKRIKEEDPTLRLEIKPFFEGNRYYATTYRDFTDVRLVFAIPKSMGKFGGETDNWMWPRQTCDFSVFRIYADPKTNKPADYSKDNVPYHPSHWAHIARNGFQEGSFSMTLGYPGSTSRYLSSYGIKERRDAQNAPRAQVRGVKQEVMWRHMMADEAVRIKYDSKYATSSNYWKNSIGMNKCIDSIGLISQKQRFEEAVQAWQHETGYLEGKLKFELMEQLYARRSKAMRNLTLWNETFRRNDELTTRALRFHNGAQPQGKGKKQYITFKDNSDTYDEATDREVLATLLKNYRSEADKEYLPDFYEKVIDAQYKGDYDAYVSDLYSKSLLMQNDKRIYTMKKKSLTDIAVLYGLDLSTVFADLRSTIVSLNDSVAAQERMLCDAIVQMEKDKAHYSDANFTMRLSYGQVKEYNLGGQPSGYYTAAPSLVEKMKRGEKIADYKVEPEMITLFDHNDFGPYTDPTTGKMQLCFLTTNDITGGNSGSPMFNGRNELIGLAFDGNWDSLSSDIFFDSDLARCIGVDIRYVVYMIDRWGHAERLIKELGL